MPITFDYAACTNSIVNEEAPDLDVQETHVEEIEEVSNSDFRQLSDADLEEAIARNRRMFENPAFVLKDNKHKLGVRIQAMEADLANRKRAKAKFAENQRQLQKASEKRGLTSDFNSPSSLNKIQKDMAVNPTKPVFVEELKLHRFSRTKERVKISPSSTLAPSKAGKEETKTPKTVISASETENAEKFSQCLAEKRERPSKRCGSSKTVTLSSDEDNGDVTVKAARRTSVRLAQRRKVDLNHKINYPSRHDPDAVEVYYRDLNHLKPMEFLNDTVIDFYIKYLNLLLHRVLTSLVHRFIQRPGALESSRKEKLYFFNSFFFKKLTRAFDTKGDKQAEAFTNLRKWTKGISIFDKSYLFLPINDKYHWSLAIVAFSEASNSMLVPHIFHLDSLEGGHSSKELFKYLRKYLELEHAQMECTIEVNWDELVTKRVEVPRQENEYDCGCFLLYYIEQFVQMAPLPCKLTEETNLFGRRWFRPCQASSLRDKIRDILEQLFEDQPSPQ